METVSLIPFVWLAAAHAFFVLWTAVAEQPLRLRGAGEAWTVRTRQAVGVIGVAGLLVAWVAALAALIG